MKELYISDLDGTLANSNGKISARTEGILNRQIDNDVAFTIATARSLDSMYDVIKTLKLKHPVIIHNGAYIFDLVRGEAIEKKLISSATGAELVNVFQTFRHNPMIYTDSNKGNKVYYWKAQSKQQIEYIERRTANGDMRFAEASHFSGNDDIVSIVAIGHESLLREIEREAKSYRGLCVILSKDIYDDSYWLEITHEEATKYHGVEYLRALLGVEKCVGFGDNKNDIDLFRACDFKVAVANAVPELKSVADEVIGSNDTDAVAKYIQKANQVSP